MAPRHDGVRVALIGYGMGGSLFHAPFISADPRLDLATVVTANPARQRDVRSRYPATGVLADMADLLTQLGTIDLVVVSTPNATHASLAEAVLARGTAVVVDKPVTPTSAATRRLATVAAAHDTWVVPFQNRRWDGDFRTVSDLIERHGVGDLHAFESRYERWQPQAVTDPTRGWKNEGQPGAGTGILLDLGTHLIDQAVVLFGRPQGVYAEVALRRQSGRVDDDVFLALQYQGGPRVHLWMSAVAADRGPRFRLLGQTGAYVKFGMDVQEERLSAGHSPSEPHWGEEPSSAWGRISTGTDRRALPTLAGCYQNFYAGMASLLLDGMLPPVDIADAVLTAEIVEAAALSSRTGTVAPLET